MRDLLTGLLLAGLTLGVYWPVRTHDIIFYDDPQFITENPQVQSGLNWNTVVYAFTRPLVGNWHPVTTLSHALDCELFGVSPGAHHLVSAFFHAANAALLFFLLQRLTRTRAETARHGATDPPLQAGFPSATWKSLFVAAIFAWHPLRVESVAWIAERKDLLSGFFFLLTLWSYACYTQKRPEKRADAARSFQASWGYYLVALLCFALGLMSKPMVVTLPFLLLLLDIWPLQRLLVSNPRSTPLAIILEKVPFFVLSIADCWITLAVQKSAGAMQLIPDITWSERLSNAITSYVRYLGKLFWPGDLAIVYPHPARHYFLNDQWPGWEIVLAALLLAMVSIVCLLQFRRRAYLAFGWFWFLGTLVPVIGLVQVGEQAMADRYTYIPLIGPVISLVWWASEIFGTGAAAWPESSSIVGKRKSPAAPTSAANGLRSPRQGTAESGRNLAWLRSPMRLVLLGAAFLVLPLLILSTRHQLGYWQNTVELFDHAVQVTPDNASAQFSLGVGLELEGFVSKAMVRYRVALAIDPHYSKAHYNMGQLLRKMGRWQDAVAAYQSAARFNPADLPTQLNLGNSLLHLGRGQEAMLAFEEALKLDPNSTEALNNLAWLLATSPKPDVRNGAHAIQLAERACSLTGFKVPVFLGTLAAAYAQAGRFPEAVETARQASERAAEVGDSASAAKNQQLLELYRAHEPYRDQP